MHEIYRLPLLAAAEMSLIYTIAAAFTAAWVLGLLTQKFKLSPIVGYLLAGIAIGPHTPGFVADPDIAHQLAEIGVILLMFGVGLHFHLKDLLAVRNVAVPGAIGQSLVATLLSLAVAAAFGWPWKSGLVLGMAMSVASTVVLMRVLMDNKMLDSVHGHVAVGWLIVEDIFTVIVLVLIPTLGTAVDVAATASGPAAVATAPVEGRSLLMTLIIALGKLGILTFLLLWGGGKIVPGIMVRVTRLRSRELFTLTVLVMAIAIAAGSYYFFGASMALGAFLAGMVVGQSSISRQAAADALPLRDAFSVIFFTSVGMLFDPTFILKQPVLLLAGLAIVLIGKPLIALVMVAIIGYPGRTALTVAIGLAQIGEFSFILSDLATKHRLLGPDGHNLLVACAILSITINPLLFRSIDGAEARLKRFPLLWKMLNFRAEKRAEEINRMVHEKLAAQEKHIAVLLGYGPVGQTIDRLLRERGLDTVVVDLNMDTVDTITRRGGKAIFGDAYNIEVVGPALPQATHLIITIPHGENRTALIAAAKLIHPTLKIFVRARYISEHDELMQVGADGVCYEEAEAARGLARLVLEDKGETQDVIEREMELIRDKYHAMR